MIEPRKDRLIYGNIIAPPKGYELDYAVATTYSLDLDALVGLCFAFDYGTALDGDDNEIQSMYTIDQLKSIKKKLVVFHQYGKIKSPGNFQKHHVLLDSALVAVKVGKSNESEEKETIEGAEQEPKKACFHPKVWVLRYKLKGENDGKNNAPNEMPLYCYRVIVLSRNITFDKSWDVSFYMDGTACDEEQTKNEPLCDFLEYLSTHIKYQDDEGKVLKEREEQKKEITELSTELMKVKFELKDSPFTDFEFLPSGFTLEPRNEKNNYKFDFKKNIHPVLEGMSGDKLFIMSPFVKSKVIDHIVPKLGENKKLVLITRQKTLDALGYEYLKKKDEEFNKLKEKLDIYKLKENVVNGLTEADDGGEQPDEDVTTDKELLKHDIHAKIFISGNNLYLGSLNATFNAVQNNVEFMIWLGLNASTDTIIEDLQLDNETEEPNTTEEANGAEATNVSVKKKNSLFCKTELVKTEKEPAAEEDWLDQILDDFIEREFTGKAEGSGDGYTLTLTLTKEYIVPYGCSFTIKPAAADTEKIISSGNAIREIEFTGLTQGQLSDFFNVYVTGEATEDEDTKTEKSILLTVPVSGIPENRDDGVNGSFSDIHSYIEYVNLRFSEDVNDIESRIRAMSDSGLESMGIAAHRNRWIYENMLIYAASKTKSKSEDFIKKLDELSSMEFDEMNEEDKKRFETIKNILKAFKEAMKDYGKREQH